MPSSQVNGTTIAATILGIIGLLTFARKLSPSPPPIQDEHDTIEDPKNSAKPFPWEPKNLQESSTTNTHRLLVKKSSPSDTEKQLQLLSTMTFANGGFRAPTCLCCA